MQKAKLVNNKLRYIQNNDTRISNVTLVKGNGRCNAMQSVKKCKGHPLKLKQLFFKVYYVCIIPKD